jgi:hypothetical protein
MYLKNMFSKISNAKMREGVFVGPQIREVIQDVKFEDHLSELEKATWNSLKNITNNFGEIIRHKTLVIWWLVLYSSIKLWSVSVSVICLETYIS